MTEATAELVAEHGISAEEYQRLLGILGREPNLVELGIFSVMWSEHCSYKSSRLHLRRLPTEGACVVQGPGENAGVIDIGDGKVAVFKMESHNHPSFIEPYQGAATGVGGILRDVFTMGARPVAILNSLRFGEPSHPKTRHLVAGVVAGIGGYGNCVGVPTVGGECTFHKSFNGNILVNAMCVGIADKDRVFYAKAGGIGNPVVYVGAKTGRDGIHGATMASAEFSEEKEAKRPTVQVGDPFTEKLLIEACLELMSGDAVVAIQDMGAAGLTSSSFEMAARGACGVDLDLDRVPLRETGMAAYEIMLSESQERMLMVLAEGREAEALAVFAKWGLDCAVVGRVTESGRLIVRQHGEVVADIPVAAVDEAAPLYDRPVELPIPPVPVNGFGGEVELAHDEALARLMACPDLASKRWIFEQYDHMVMADTVMRPGGDAAVVRIHGSRRGLALTTDCTPRYCAADPYAGGMQAVAEAWRNLTATGARPLAITNCLNFGNPERPRVMGQLAAAIDGMAAACRALDFPVVSGNVSLYNETDGRAIQPTPAIGGVGLIDDLERMRGIALTEPGLHVLVVGVTQGWLGASLYRRELIGRDDGAPPPVDLAAERRQGDLVRELIVSGRIAACHDIGDGGLLVALAEMCLAGDLGVSLSVPGDVDAVGWLFGEDQARYLLAVRADDLDEVLRLAGERGVVVHEVARSGGDALRISGLPPISLAKLRSGHEGWLPGYMAGEA